jgi:cysteinyl-tRNA synthetase
MKYLGATIDIHGGGLENQFPHHECEIAQSEAANGVPFVRYWLHNNMVTVDGQKMGKSLNNFITLKQAFTGAHEKLTRNYDPLAVRQLILNSHYRSPIDFSDAALFAAQSGYNRITETVKALRKEMSQAADGELDKQVAEQLEQLKARFEAAMNDDLNTSVALSVVFDLVRLATKLFQDGNATAQTLGAIDKLFGRFGGDVLGIVKDEYPEAAGGDDDLMDKLVNVLIDQRKQARKEKDFAKADDLRNRLDAMGIVLEDTPDKTTWRMK